MPPSATARYGRAAACEAIAAAVGADAAGITLISPGSGLVLISSDSTQRQGASWRQLADRADLKRKFPVNHFPVRHWVNGEVDAQVLWVDQFRGFSLVLNEASRAK